MEDATVITVAELVRGGQAVTGASSLYFSAFRPSSHSSSVSDGCNRQSRAGGVNFEASSKVLKPMTHPVILVGTVALPLETLECPNRYCFRFSDGDWTLCCDILGLEIGAIEKKICVLAWNFLPMEHGGGFLEIIKWKLLVTGESLVRCSSVDSFPLVPCSHSRQQGDSKSRYGVHGVIESISPVSIVPCSSQCSAKAEDFSDPVNLRGFLVSLMACECELGTSRAIWKSEGHVHSFAKPVFIYFCGSMAACWHPMITKLVDSIVVLSGMKKKLVYISKSDYVLTFVTTESTFLHSPGFSKKRVGSRTVTEKRGNCRSYLGIVKGVYMGGKLVELDEDVWLLLTDMIHNRPHSFRVGCLIYVRNVHFVNTKFPWGKVLILGACFKTSITVEAFSPFETICHVDSHTPSAMSQLIESLSFPARFWALLVMSCFQNFTGILSEKEAFGSYQKDKMTKIYAESRIPSSMFQPRLGLFPEFCMHESCGCNSKAHDCSLKLVVPVSSFIQHYKVMLNELLLPLKKDDVFGTSNCFSHPSSVCKIYGRSTTKILRSEDIGIILLGKLKVSSSSGRIQLHDGAAHIDVRVPDFSSNMSVSKIHEVADYCVIIEGTPEIMLHLQSPGKPFSCRSIVNCTLSTMESTLPMFISLRFDVASCRNVLFHPSLVSKPVLNELKSGKFHIFRVTHKFPNLQNGDPVMRKSSSVFIEAVLLPWDLIWTVTEGDIDPREFYEGRISQEKNKNTGDKPQSERISFVPNIAHEAHEISCQVIIRSASNISLVTSGTLCNANDNKSSNKHNIKRVLLECISEWEKYNRLQIGGYYLMKHSTEDSFCFGRSGIFNNDKIIFRPETPVWSLAFSFGEVLTDGRSMDDFPSANGRKGFLTTQPMDQQNSSLPEPSSDVSLHLSYDVKRFFSVYLKDLENLNKPVAMGAEASNVSSSAQGATTTHVWPSLAFVSNNLFPEGNLTSLKGDVVTIDADEARVGDVSVGYCIHVLVDLRNVKIFGSLSRHSYLTGFGPGVNATFYRILETREKNQFLLSPASFIKINSLEANNKPVTEDPTSVAVSCAPSITSHESGPAGSITDLFLETKEHQAMNLVCKVLCVHLLILQRSLDSSSENQSGEIIDIPLAGFVIDDGSSTCLCWTSGKSAYAFLRLHEKLPDKSMYGEAWFRGEGSRSTLLYHLEGLVRKHNRVVIKNKGLQIDTFFQDITISVGSNQPLTYSEDRFLKFFMIHVIRGPVWTVAVRSMNTETIKRLEREMCVDMETAKLSLHNIWGFEVSRADQLARAKTLLQGLLNR